MCIKCEMKKAALAMMGKEQVVKKVGVLSDEFLKEIKAMREASGTLEAQVEEEMTTRLDEFNAQLRKELEAKYEKKWNDLNTVKKQVWNDALASVGATADLDEDGIELSVNRKTGELEVTTVQDITNVAAGIH